MKDKYSLWYLWGSLVVVSHDPDFLDPLVHESYERRDPDILGTVSDYLSARTREDAAAASVPATIRPIPAPPANANGNGP